MFGWLQIIGRVVELNDTADRGQPISADALMHDSWDDVIDDVFAAAPPSRQQQLQQQALLHTSARLNTTVNSSGVAVPANTSFDFRTTAAPPVQVRETTM